MVKKRKSFFEREISIQKGIRKAEQLGLFMYDIQANVAFTTFMTAVTLFFAGLVLSQYDAFDFTVKIPVLFLIIATGGFLISTLIYSNSGGEVSHGKLRNFEKFLFLANILSEFCGVYFLMFAIPLVVVASTTDLFLRMSTLIVVSIGFLLYHFSRFDIMGRYVKNGFLHAVSFMLILYLLFYLQFLQSWFFVYLGVFLVLYVLGLIIYVIHKRHVKWWA